MVYSWPRSSVYEKAEEQKENEERIQLFDRMPHLQVVDSGVDKQLPDLS
jgi:hypothetical protein